MSAIKNYAVNEGAIQYLTPADEERILHRIIGEEGLNALIDPDSGVTVRTILDRHQLADSDRPIIEKLIHKHLGAYYEDDAGNPLIIPNTDDFGRYE